MRMKLTDVRAEKGIKYITYSSKKNIKLEVVVHVGTSKYKYILTKCYLLDWTEEIFSIKEVKDTVAWICVIEELNDNTIGETFYEQNLQKTSQDKFKGKTVLNTEEIKYVSKWIQ